MSLCSFKLRFYNCSTVIYKNIRLNWLENLEIDLNSAEESKNIKNIYEIIFHNPKETAKYLVNLMEIRSKNMSDSK